MVTALPGNASPYRPNLRKQGKKAKRSNKSSDLLKIYQSK